MSTFQKPPQTALLDYDYARSLHDGASFSSYGQAPYVASTPMVPSPMADHASQISDCVPYMSTNQEYASSYEGHSPMLSAETPSMPEIISFSPQRGVEGTRVCVRIQSPYDLHTSSYTLHLVFGGKKCECIPHFFGFRGSCYEYGLSADTPSFLSTGSPSLAVPLQLTMDIQSECTTLQVGVYTYEATGQYSPSDESRKRRISSLEEPIPRPIKRPTAPPVQPKEQPISYSAASYSPYLQSLPAGNGFVNPYQGTSSPRMVPNTSQSSMRAPSPLTPSWSPSYLPLAGDSRAPSYAVSHGYRQTRPASPGRLSSNPPLIRTSTLQQSSGMGQTQTFNPYAMYPSKAVLKLNGDLNTMTEKWSREESDAKRRLVQFTRMQSGSTIHADFKPVTPEERTPNSICISCIYWDGKDECFVTSVDTIYLLESLVGVRFTVEEKNRIRRNLEGFRPLTVSKAKADSEDFFKVIMGFPAPKPRNIEKDVKVFPWKILAHALKKIIGKYSASYSSTAGALPTPISSNYTSTGAGSDSGTEPQTTGSPNSIPDTSPSSTYGTVMSTPAYSAPSDHHGPPMTAPELRAVLPSISQPYTNMPSAYSYSGVCQPQSQLGLPAHSSRAWELSHLMNSTGSGAPSSNACYSYLAPPLPNYVSDPSHGS